MKERCNVKSQSNELAENVVPMKPITRIKEMKNAYGDSESTVRRRMTSEPDFPKPFRMNEQGGIAFWSHELLEYYSNKPRIDKYQGNK